MSTDPKRLEWNKRHLGKLDDIKIRRPKGERAIVTEHADKKGKSLNAYVNGLIDDDMQKTSQAEGLTMEEYVNKLRAKAAKKSQS